MMFTCSECNSHNSIEDFTTGDTICTDCGLCTKDLMISGYNETLNFIEEKSKFHQLLDSLNLNDGIYKNCTELYKLCQQHMSFKGYAVETICSGILYIVYKDLQIECIEEKMTKNLKSFIKKVESFYNVDHYSSTIIQRYILQFTLLTSCEKNRCMDDIHYVLEIPKSSKIQAAVLIYNSNKEYITEICKQFKLQKTQVIKAHCEVFLNNK